jgi:hypothetical protein
MALAGEREREESGEKYAREAESSRESGQAVSITANVPAFAA